MTHEEHLLLLSHIRNRLNTNNRERESMFRHLREAARYARADGLSVAAIAEAIGASRYYAHTLIHGRKSRPERT